MDTTIGINLGANPMYKSIPDVYKSFWVDAIKQLLHQALFEERMILAKSIDRVIAARSQSLEHLDEAEAALASKPPKVKESYHSAAEVKDAIANNIDSIYAYFGERDFSLSAFTDHLKSYVTLREHDYTPHLVHNRWEQQVSHAIRKVKVENYIIENTSRRGYYAIKPTKPTPLS